MAITDPVTFLGWCDQEGYWPSSHCSVSSSCHRNKKQTVRPLPRVRLGGLILTSVPAQRRAESRVGEAGLLCPGWNQEWWGPPESFLAVHPNPREADPHTHTHSHHLLIHSHTNSESHILQSTHKFTHTPKHLYTYIYAHTYPQSHTLEHYKSIDTQTHHLYFCPLWKPLNTKLRSIEFKHFKHFLSFIFTGKPFNQISKKKNK